MAINWQNIAVALASRLQFEVACGRRRLLTEDLSRLFLAEVLQTQISGSIEPEHNHCDLPGNTRVDLILKSPTAQNIEAAVEHKWVRRTTERTVRQWMSELIGDVMRVEALTEQMVQGSERVVCVSGEVNEMRSKIWESESRRGNGAPRVGVVETLLQSRIGMSFAPQRPKTVNLRQDGRPFLSKLRHGTPELVSCLPVRYSVQLAGYHRAHPEGIECVVWLIKRPVGQRVTFDATQEWQ
jgi:hypothetical protein